MRVATCLSECLTGAFIASAAPVIAADPVAEGYPAWQGVVEKNHLAGREITASDLRHRVTVVIEVEVNGSLREQLSSAGEFTMRYPVVDGLGVNWEGVELKREVIVLIAVHGNAKDLAKTVAEALQPPDGADDTLRRNLREARAPYTPVYANVRFEGTPDAAGKRPYAYVLGATGKELLYQGRFDKASRSDLANAISSARNKMSEGGARWVPLYGSLDEADYPQELVSALAKGKSQKPSPLDPIARAILKKVAVPDRSVASKAQMSFDAIQQARSDLIMRIWMEYQDSPHCAYYDLQTLLRYWPGEKKRFASVTAVIKGDPQAAKLAQMYCRVMEWLDPNIVCKSKGESKKIVGELMQMKKSIGKMKESETVVVQNGSLLLDAKIDELISSIPTRVAGR